MGYSERSIREKAGVYSMGLLSIAYLMLVPLPSAEPFLADDAAQVAAQRGEQKEGAPRTDDFGDPLPPGALARLGTARLRHSEAIVSFALSADGTVLASGAFDTERGVRVWDARTGKELYRIEERGGLVAISPDSKTLVTGGEGATLFCWDLHTGKETRQISVASARGKRIQGLRQVSFSPTSKYLAVSSWYADPGSTTIHLLDSASGKQIVEFSAPDDGGHGSSQFVFSPDSRSLAMIEGKENTVYLWEVATGRIRARLGKGALTCVFSPDGKTLFLGEAMAIRLIDLRTQKETRRFTDFPGLYTAGTGALAVSPDGKILAAGGGYGDSSIRLWNIGTGKLIREIPAGPAKTLAFSADSTVLVSATNVLRLWDVRTGKECVLAEVPRLALSCAVFAPDGKSLAVTGGVKGARLIDVATRKELHRFSEDEFVRALAFSPDGKNLALAGKQLHLGEVTSGKMIRSFKGHSLAPSSVAFSRDGRVLVSGSYDGTVRRWETATGKEISQFRHPSGRSPDRLLGVHAVALFPDGKNLASLAGQTIRVWDVDTSKVASQYSGQDWNGPCGPLALSPDGKVLAFEQYEVDVVLQDVDGNEPRHLIASRDGPVRHWGVSFAFSPNGRLLATGSADKSVRLWDVASGKELRKFAGHQDWVVHVAFAPDGRTLASASRDSTVLMWDVATAK